MLIIFKQTQVFIVLKKKQVFNLTTGPHAQLYASKYDFVNTVMRLRLH
jgi:hypothetical protein